MYVKKCWPKDQRYFSAGIFQKPGFTIASYKKFLIGKFGSGDNASVTSSFSASSWITRSGLTPAAFKTGSERNAATIKTAS